MSLEPLQYPIGHFISPKQLDLSLIEKSLEILRNFPVELETLIAQFTPELWQTSYRPEGWTAAQLVHHIADSHMHSYLRFKFAALEDCPTIKAYNEGDWAEQIDATQSNVSASMSLIKGVHQRMVDFLESLDKNAYSRSFFHPEMNDKVPIFEAIPMYAWHSKHHLGHLQIIFRQKP
ncbi:MAG: YfiT family bacillithiol transferase [Flavobacteriaceae bacterium]